MKTLFICLILIFGSISKADAAMSVGHKDTLIITDEQQEVIEKEAAEDAVLHYKDRSFLLMGIVLSWLLTPIVGYLIMQKELRKIPTENLNMPPEKMGNPIYAKAYQQKAWEIKKQRIKKFFKTLIIAYLSGMLIGALLMVWIVNAWVAFLLGL
jgi:hypothetical protein